MKSKTSASTMTRMMSDVSGILHRHLFNDIAERFDFIGALLQGAEDIFPADDIKEIFFAIKKIRDGFPVDAVNIRFKTAQALCMLHELRLVAVDILEQ